MTANSAKLKVWLLCTGVGIMNRGIESFFRECFDGLHPLAASHGIQLELIKGAGPEANDERRVWCLPRTGLPARILGKLAHRNGYVIEQLSAVPAVKKRIRQDHPDVIVYSDVNLAMRLQNRSKVGWPGYKLLYSNGAPGKPPFTGCDHVQQVAPFYLDQALSAGEPPEKHSMVPYGFTVPKGEADFDPAFRAAVRKQLSLPEDRKIVLSVGWIAAIHKRMDYLIQEITSLPTPRPYLVMLGAMDERSPAILQLAAEKLGQENFCARSVSYNQVFDYYKSADIFALCSLQEGFGRVYAEACMHGLPCAAHDQAVMRFVLGEEGSYADLSKPGQLAAILNQLLAKPLQIPDMTRRRQTMHNRFSWQSLAPDYFQMFRKAAKTQILSESI